MKTVGIIAEFNPFHNGHEYMIAEAKKRTGADFCVAVMSGSFVQRGEPAFMYKYDRVRSALNCGVDAVFELPISYATATAETFAYGGVSILDSLGIDAIAFGAECDDLGRLSGAADLILNPSDEYLAAIDEAVKKGDSYPAARAKALPAYEDLLSLPNNILAVEYIKAVKRLNSNLEICVIKRMGSGYHEDELTEYASAEAIRNAVSSRMRRMGAFIPLDFRLPEDIDSCIPSTEYDIMSAKLGHTFPITADDLGEITEYILLSDQPGMLASYQDMNSDLANKFKNSYRVFMLEEDRFCLTEYIKFARSKELTYTRISRALLHCVLRQKDLTRDAQGGLIPCPYTRLLGFKSDASGLMHKITGDALIPIVNKAGDAASILPDKAYPYFEATISADRLYDMLISQKYGTRLTDGCRISPVII